MSKLPVKAASPLRINPQAPAGSPRPIARLLRFPVVRGLTGLSRSTIWRLERAGLFPRHRRIAPNIVAWLEADITTWIEATAGDRPVPNAYPSAVRRR